MCTRASPLALIDHDACRADLRRASSHPISTGMRKKFHCSLLLVLFALPCVNPTKERDAHGDGTTHEGGKGRRGEERAPLYVPICLPVCLSVRPSVRLSVGLDGSVYVLVQQPCYICKRNPDTSMLGG